MPSDRPDTPGPGAGSSRTLGRALLVEARPRQWIKNLLVFAAPGAAGVLNEASALARSAGAFVCFCLAASGTYYLNDAADIEADRAHPTKRHRPVAAGEIPLPTARLIGAAALVVAIAGALLIDPHLGAIVACYVVLTTAYSAVLKHIVIVDVVAVAAGFVLRAVAGGAAVEVPISDWFFIVTCFGSLFMVVGKRRAELAALGDDAGATRAILDQYTPSFLAQMQTLSAAVMLVGYCLWAFEKAHASSASVPLFELSIIPFAMAVMRYALLIDTGQGGAPEEVVLGDRMLQIMGLAWAILFAAGVMGST